MKMVAALSNSLLALYMLAFLCPVSLWTKSDRCPRRETHPCSLNSLNGTKCASRCCRETTFVTPHPMMEWNPLHDVVTENAGSLECLPSLPAHDDQRFPVLREGHFAYPTALLSVVGSSRGFLGGFRSVSRPVDRMQNWETVRTV